MPSQMKMLDLFSGLKGASAAMKDRGWKVVTVDIDPFFSPDIVSDIRHFSWEGKTLDLVWASPPCHDFTRLPWLPIKEIDFSLVDAVLRIVREVKPRFWVLENVRDAQRFLGRAPAHYGPYFLWGWYPKFSVKIVKRPKESMSSNWKAERAKIPYELSQALALVIERKSK